MEMCRIAMTKEKKIKWTSQKEVENGDSTLKKYMYRLWTECLLPKLLYTSWFLYFLTPSFWYVKQRTLHGDYVQLKRWAFTLTASRKLEMQILLILTRTVIGPLGLLVVSQDGGVVLIQTHIWILKVLRSQQELWIVNLVVRGSFVLVG